MLKEEEKRGGWLQGAPKYIKSTKKAKKKER